VTARHANRRIRLVVAVFAAVFAVALVRATWLQAFRAGELDQLAVGQHREVVTLHAHRGTIYDRMGVELAIGEPAVTVSANPMQIQDPRTVALAAGRALDLAPEDLLPLLSDRSRGFVYLARRADPAGARALEQQGIVGLSFEPEERRGYPQRGVGAEVVGYAGVDNSGLAGLELGLDGVLAGRDGSETVVRDPTGRVLRAIATAPARDGRSVTVTLDHTLQAQTERILRATRERWQARSATAIVLDPRTGDVLAMAVEPGFDANRFPQVPRDRQRNRAVTDTYEPGSTFKIVTIAGVLENGLVSPSTSFTLSPQIQVADRVIHDAEPRGTETMTVADILAKSSNVGTITLALQLQADSLAEWISRFGFGHMTGIDFPGESAGIVLPPDEWSGSTIGNVPIGQGIAVTPVQMAAAYATIANGGVSVRPHLVERVSGRPATRPQKRRVVSEATATEITKMLSRVVSEGSGTAAQVPGYRVAGKTGTAAKPDASGGYSDTRYVASFVGFVPASHPRLVVLVAIDEPSGTIWGGEVAAPAFAEIATFALQYLEVPPDALKSVSGTIAVGSQGE
jgi:cell division protein FtsI (penicillin-binding protein 3)